MEADRPTHPLAWAPNALTLTRCVLAIFVGFALQATASLQGTWPVAALSNAPPQSTYGHALPLVLFIVAALTDFFDGRLARRLNAHSAFGELIDPIADKLLVLIPLCWLSAVAIAHAPTGIGVLIALPTALIFLRDVVITSLRFFPMGRRISTPSALAKAKTALEMVTLTSLLSVNLFNSELIRSGLIFLGLTGLWFAASASAATGIGYIRALRQT